MKRLVVTVFHTDRVLRWVDVIVKLPAEDTEIDVDRLVHLIWDKNVDWREDDFFGDRPCDFDIKGEPSDDDESSLPLIDYES